jgi:hypothetical protein
MVGGSERLLEAPGAVLSDREQVVCQASSRQVFASAAPGEE